MVLQFTSQLEISTNKIWGCHFRVPDIAVQTFTDKDRRVVCRLNGFLEFPCAMLPNGNGDFVITVNRANQKKLKTGHGGVVQVELRKDDSEYGLPLAEEKKEVLEQDPEGSELFHALTKGKQRTLLYIVNNTKKSEMRIAKTIVILEHLKETSGTIESKVLNQALKSENLKRYLGPLPPLHKY